MDSASVSLARTDARLCGWKARSPAADERDPDFSGPSYGFFSKRYWSLMFLVKNEPLDSAAMSCSYTSCGTP